MHSHVMDMSKKDETFWDSVTRYASDNKDESFVDEVAYMMVTLYRTGS